MPLRIVHTAVPLELPGFAIEDFEKVAVLIRNLPEGEGA